MKTKEEILIEYGCNNDNDALDKNDILSAMEEYAKEIAIDFLRSVRDYETDINNGKDPLNEAMNCEDYYETYFEVGGE